MQKTILLAQRISKSLDENWFRELEIHNLHRIFRPIYEQDFSIGKMNKLFCFIIFAYDNDSTWLNLKQDRLENKKRILESLDADDKYFESIVTNEDETINSVIAEFVIEQTDWRWQTIFSLLDYHANMIRYVNRKTEDRKSIEELDKEGAKHTLYEDIDATTVTKINREKGDLLSKALDARKKADDLIAEIRTETVHLEHAVQQDFNFSITDEKKIDPMSWRQFIARKKSKAI